MDIVCRQVETPADIEKFIGFPNDLYKGDNCYVAELYMAQKVMLDKSRYPFFAYGDTALFLAYKNGKVVGRIAAIDNPRYNDFHQSNVGFFGFFDSIKDHEVVGKLFSEVRNFGKHKHFDKMIGPTNYTTNETAGVLIDGFDAPPVIMMTYNYPYYESLLISEGLQKEMDLLAYFLKPEEINHKSVRLLPDLEKRLEKDGITIKKLNKNIIHRESIKIREIYHRAWIKNWGFVPFTDEEFDFLKNDLAQIMDPDFTFLAEKNGEPVGFCIAIPNINEILIKYKRGKLFPFGFIDLLLHKNKTKTMRILALGVVPEMRKKGIEAVFYAKCILAALSKSQRGAEASWILANNQEMNQALINLYAKQYKTYRLYSLPL
ncbi:MAG: GNAT family N-acetyltransferase [Saprospiraceae bacterium]|nr:GNAT family N-acetyltransferase [Saprospiraceae bacterium]